jgi:3-oxoacyl-[acyl-carrier-protein] synthase II
LRRVVVTGIGLCAPLDFESAARGEDGLTTPAGWSLAESPGLRVGRVPGEAAEAVRALPGRWRPDRLDPFSWFALLAAHAARLDAGLEAVPRAAVVVASSMGGERTHDHASSHLTEHRVTGSRLRVSPFTAPKLMPNAASANVGQLLGAHGPNVAPAAACASGAYALAQAADLIRLGRADVAFAGASDAPLEEIAARAFMAGEALAPDGQSLPFHRERRGFVLSEGAAILVLEEREAAARRGVRAYAELCGVGLTCDAHHIVAPHPDGTHAAEAMRLALAEARLSPADIGYVNAHATGTALGDLAECAALRSVFGPHRPAVSSTKGAVGHLLGAAGALEAAYAVLALHRGLLPVTRGLSEATVDPHCAEGLDLVVGEPRETRVDAVLTNSFAFGGHNAALVFRRA